MNLDIQLALKQQQLYESAQRANHARDEIHHADVDEMNELGQTFQHLLRAEQPVAFAGAGLPGPAIRHRLDLLLRLLPEGLQALRFKRLLFQCRENLGKQAGRGWCSGGGSGLARPSSRLSAGGAAGARGGPFAAPDRGVHPRGQQAPGRDGQRRATRDNNDGRWNNDWNNNNGNWNNNNWNNNNNGPWNDNNWNNNNNGPWNDNGQWGNRPPPPFWAPTAQVFWDPTRQAWGFFWGPLWFPAY